MIHVDISKSGFNIPTHVKINNCAAPEQGAAVRKRKRTMQTTLPTATPSQPLPNPATVDLMQMGALILLGVVLVLLIFIVVKIIHDLRSYRYR